MTEKLPPEIPGNETLRNMHAQAQCFIKESIEFESSSFPSSFESEQQSAPVMPTSDSDSSSLQEQRPEGNDDEASGVVPSMDGGNVTLQESNNSFVSNTEVSPPQSKENSSRPPESYRPVREGETSIIEQFEHGVYVTLILLPNGIKVFKRVRFRYDC